MRWQRWRRPLALAVLLVWAPLMVLAVGSLMVSHWAPFERPTAGQRLRGEVQQRRGGRGGLHLVHVVYEHCSCTEGLTRHLLARGARAPAGEHVIIVAGGEHRRAAFETAGYRFETLSAADYRHRFGAEAAPLLVVSSSAGPVDYLGGYYDHPAATRPRTEHVVARVEAGRTVAPLPLYGCAVGDALQARVDPLALKYPAQ